MEHSVFEESHMQKQTKRFAVWVGAIALLYALVLTPLNLFLTSDILLADTVLPLLCDVLMLVCNYAFYWIAFTYILYRNYRFGTGECKPLFVIYTITVLLRYIVCQLATYVTLGFPRLESFFKDDFIYLVINVLLDFLMLLGAVLLMNYLRKRWETQSTMLSALPTERLFQKEVPLLRVLLCIAAIPAGVQLLTRLIYDVSYGLPKDLPDLLWMIVYYLSDIIFVLIGYLVSVLLINRLFLDEETARIEFDSTSVLSDREL